MAAIITEKFRMSNAEVFKDQFGGTDSYYMFLGKSSPFSALDALNASDSSPPVPDDDVTSEYYYHDDMLAAKKLTASDASFVIPRRNWVNQGTFDMYEHDISSSNTTTSSATNLFNSTFYFVTSEFRVYKVLDNNGGIAMTSGSEPTSEATGPFTSNGYVLQYMYTISANDADKFLTNDFIPVATNNSVAAAATDGAIVSARVVNAGSGLTNGTYFSPVYGDGTNAGTASGAILRLTVAAGQISSFGLTSGTDTTVHAAGAGYTYGKVNLSTLFSDAGLNSSSSIGTVGSAVVEVIIGPKGGHGANAPKELGGHYVMVNTTFSNAEAQDITEANDFRRVGILKNPYAFGTTAGNTFLSTSTARTTKALKLASAGLNENFVTDEKITQSTTGAIGKVVEYDSTNDILYYVQERFTDHGTNANQNFVAFSGANTVSGATGAGTPDASADGTVDGIPFTDGYGNSEIQPDSGDIIYIENRSPITRVSDQVEDIKIIVEF